MQHNPSRQIVSFPLQEIQKCRTSQQGMPRQVYPAQLPTLRLDRNQPHWTEPLLLRKLNQQGCVSEGKQPAYRLADFTASGCIQLIEQHSYARKVGSVRLYYF